MRSVVSTLVFLAVYALPALMAQRGIGLLYPNNLPGDASLPVGSTAVGAIVSIATGNFHEDLIGVARLPNGHYIISANRAVGVPLVSPHKFFELNSDGSFLAAIDQPDRTATLISGLQDLAWDGLTGPESRIHAGFGKLLFAYDWHGGVFDLVPITAGKLLAGYVGSQVQGAAIADIDGQLVLISAHWENPEDAFSIGSPVNYHTLDAANPLTLFKAATDDFTDPDPALPPEDFGKFGAAYDSVRETVWWSLDMQNTNPNPNHSALRFVEVDLAGDLTGKVYQGDRNIGGAAHGCEIYQDEFGNTVMVYMSSDLSVNGLEVLVEVYGGFEFGASCGGSVSYVTEPFIGNADFQIRLSGAPQNFTNTAFLFRGQAVPLPGLTIPGINNCGLLLDLGGLRQMGAGALPLVAGAVSFDQALPDLAGLVGFELSFQWLLPTAPAILPLDLSDAGTLTIGSNL